MCKIIFSDDVPTLTNLTHPPRSHGLSLWVRTNAYLHLWVRTNAYLYLCPTTLIIQRPGGGGGVMSMQLDRSVGKGLVHVSKHPIIPPEECARAIQIAEDWAAANGGWLSDRHVELEPPNSTDATHPPTRLSTRLPTHLSTHLSTHQLTNELRSTRPFAGMHRHRPPTWPSRTCHHY